MNQRPDDVCPALAKRIFPAPQPLAPPLYAASVYPCESPDHAEAVFSGLAPGYAYQRDGHPNADLLADKCRQLHQAPRAVIAASGMAAMSVALLSQLQAGDHVIVSRHLYGRSLQLLTQEAGRLGIGSTVVDTCDLPGTAATIRPQTKLIVVETIANPLLQVADIASLAALAHAHQALLLVDNTFATPVLCRPLEWGADLVLESLSKMMNGHSDVILGLLCGTEAVWQRVPLVLSAWGLASSPFDCWLTLRGLSTLALRFQRAADNAVHAAQFLASRPEVAKVDYPGLPGHPDHQLARRQFFGQFGAMVTFHLAGGRAAGEQFLAAAGRIPFCPSLGEVSTTLSHPESTSHRGLTPDERERLGIGGGTLRLSVGCESREFVLDALTEGLAGLR
jgi:cystathionine beta-lyase/cystathionine gamma-synthase